MKARHILALVVLCGLCAEAFAQPVLTPWRPPRGCTSGQAIVWNGSAWACGSVGGSYTAGDGITLTANDFDLTYTSDFTITSDQLDLSTAVTAPGTLSVAGVFTAGDTPASDTHTINGATTLNGPGGTALFLASASGTTTDVRIWTAGIANQGFIRYDETAQDLSFSIAAAANKHLRIDASGHVYTANNLTAGDTAASDTHAINGATTITGTSSVQPLHVIGRDGATSGIVARLSSNTSGSRTMLQISDGVTYNWGIGAASASSFQILQDTFAGSAGTTLLTVAGTTGLLTPLGGGTTTANWTTTGSGDLVSADAITSGGILTAGDAATDGPHIFNGRLIMRPNVGSDGANVTMQLGNPTANNPHLGLAGYADAAASAYVMHNAYAEYNGSGAATTKWDLTNGSFGSRLIRFNATDGIVFYADNVATTAGSSFTPTERVRITNTGETVFSGGTIANTTNGIHVGFASNIGTITAQQPGTAYRQLNLEGSALGFSVSGTSAMYVNGSSSVFMGDSPNTSIGNNVDALSVGDSGTAQTTNGLAVARISHSGSFNTTAGTIEHSAIIASNTATRSSGANSLYNYGLYAASSGAQVNIGVYSTGTQYSFWGIAGTLYNANDLQVDGNTTLGNVTTDTTTINGVTTINSGLPGTPYAGLKVLSGSGNFGGIGIGRTAIDGYFVVASGANSYNTGTAAGDALVFASGGGKLHLSAKTIDTGAVAATIDTSGNFGIGDTTPDYLLDVAGTLGVDGNTQLTGTLTVDGSISLNSNTINLGNAATDTVTFYGGAIGINGPGATHFEWNDDFLMVNLALPVGYHQTLIGNIYQALIVGTAAQIADVTGVTGRPGIISLDTGTTTTGKTGISTSSNVVNFADGSWHWGGTVAVPTISDGSNTYAVVAGFFDTPTAANQTDGCYFTYDQADVATNPGTGSATGGAFWQCWCASNGTRTGYTMNGTNVSDESFTTISQGVAAVTYPNTNVYRLEVRMAGSTRAEFYVNGTKSCNINTNLPTGSSRLEGAGAFILKSAGATSRSLHIDQTRVFIDLSAVRNP